MKTTNINFNMGLGVLDDTTEGSVPRYTLYCALLHISTSVHRFKFIFNILHNKFALLNSISFEFALMHFLINIMWIWNWKPWKAYLYAHIKCIWTMILLHIGTKWYDYCSQSGLFRGIHIHSIANMCSLFTFWYIDIPKTHTSAVYLRFSKVNLIFNKITVRA